MFDNFNGPHDGRGRGGIRGNRGNRGNRGGGNRGNRGRGNRGRGPGPQHRGNRNKNQSVDAQSAHWTAKRRFVPNGAIPNFTPEFKPYRRPSYKAFLQAIKVY